MDDPQGRVPEYEGNWVRIGPGARGILEHGDLRSDRNLFRIIEIWIPKLPPGVNTFYSGIHWTRRVRLKDEWRTYISVSVAHSGVTLAPPVAVAYTRFSTKLMDWDNCAGSFKLLGDALVTQGVLEDDSPTIIRSFEVYQQRVQHRKDQGVLVRIEAIK